MFARGLIILFLLGSLAGLLGGDRVLAAPPVFDLVTLEDETPLLRWMEYLPDAGGSRDWSVAMASPDWRPLTKSRLGYLRDPIWTRLGLANSSPQLQTVILFNQRPLLAHLSVTVLDNQGFLEERTLGFFEPSGQRRAIIHRLANIAITLPPGATRTVLARLETAGMMEADWIAATVATFSRDTLTDFLVLGLYCGVMLALMIQGFVTWLTFRQNQFLIFVAYALFFLLYMLTINGVTRIFSLGLPVRFWFVAPGIFIYASVLCWIPFTAHFLNTAKTMPTMHRWLWVLQGVFVLAVLASVLGVWRTEIFRLTSVWMSAGLLVQATVLVVGLLAVVRRVDHAWLYLLGNAVFFFAAGQLAMLTHGNLIHDIRKVLLLQPLVVILHLTTMVVSLGMLVREAQVRLDRQERLLLEESRFATVGRTLGMLAHQWRAPLARLGAQLTELRAYFRFAEDIREQVPLIRDALLPAMQAGLIRLADTVEDLQDIFSADRPSETFAPQPVLDQVLDLLYARIVATGVQVERRLQPGAGSIRGHPAALAHVLLVLVGNALEMFTLREVREPRLTIVLDQDTRANQILLSISDNAGGILAQPLGRVFDPFYSEKGRYHMGLGLGIARKLVKDCLGGTIEVQNVGPGARFTLRMPGTVTSAGIPG